MRTARLLLIGALFLLVVQVPFASLASHHEEAEQGDVPAKQWDQAVMTDLTKRLATSIRGLRDAYRQSPNFRNPENVNRRSAQALDQTLRNLGQSTSSLATRVGKGEGVDETRPTVRRIGMLLRDAGEEGRRMTFGAWSNEQLREAMTLVNEIAPFYGSGPVYDTETLNRIGAPVNRSMRPPVE